MTVTQKVFEMIGIFSTYFFVVMVIMFIKFCTENEPEDFDE